MEMTFIKQIEAHKVETTMEFRMPVPQDLYEEIYEAIKHKIQERNFDLEATVNITVVKKEQKTEGVIKEINIL